MVRDRLRPAADPPMLSAPQHTPAGDWLRSWKRPLWRRWCRAERIAVREARKAALDAMVFGVGYTRMSLGADGWPIVECIDPENAMVRP